MFSLRYLIYSDVHGNLPAFENIVKKEESIDSYICLGDLVNYGPWSNKCIDFALSLKSSVVLMGNHEEAFINGDYPGDNQLVKSFFNHTFSEFNRLNEIKQFKDHFVIDIYTCKHTLFNKYIYPDTDIILDNNYFIGHSHHQFQYINNDFNLFNVGSVGQNRKIINLSNYIILDSSLDNVELKSLLFNLDLLVNEMMCKKYPQTCIDYYLSKEKI